MDVLLNRLKLILLGLLVFLFNQFAASDPYLENLKNDTSVPEHCRETELNDFSVKDLGIFTVSITSTRGPTRFTFEYPIKRHHAHSLWGVMKNYVKNEVLSPSDKNLVNSNEELKRNFNVLKNNYKTRGFSFGSEGEILELLAHVALQKQFNSGKTGVFVTGSVEYRRFQSGQVLGELDVVIADKEDCKVLAYGEAKLGTHRASKAWGQVQRFMDFLNYKSINPVFSEVEDDWMGLPQSDPQDFVTSK